VQHIYEDSSIDDLSPLFEYTGWPKKVSHYQVSPLNRIKNRH